MGVTDIVARDIVDHDALVEGVKAKDAILPALLLALQIMCVETAVLDHWGCILGGGDGKGRGKRSGCHIMDMSLPNSLYPRNITGLIILRV